MAWGLLKTLKRHFSISRKLLKAVKLFQCAIWLDAIRKVLAARRITIWQSTSILWRVTSKQWLSARQSQTRCDALPLTLKAQKHTLAEVFRIKDKCWVITRLATVIRQRSGLSVVRDFGTLADYNGCLAAVLVPKHQDHARMLDGKRHVLTTRIVIFDYSLTYKVAHCNLIRSLVSCRYGYRAPE